MHYLSRALIRWYASADAAGLDAYSERALARVWQAERFSWWMTTLMHRLNDEGEFGQRIQESELDYLAASAAAMSAAAEQYAGLPL